MPPTIPQGGMVCNAMIGLPVGNASKQVVLLDSLKWMGNGWMNVSTSTLAPPFNSKADYNILYDIEQGEAQAQAFTEA